MASCGNQCGPRHPQNLLSGSDTRTKHSAVAKVKKLIRQVGEDGQMKEKLKPEQFYMVPELFEAVSKGDRKYFDDLPVANQTHIVQHEGEKMINILPEMSRSSCLSLVTYSGDTVLHIAARFGQLEVARWICETGGSDLLTTPNNRKETPLHYAAQAGNLGLLRYFVRLASQKGSNINKDDFLQKINEDGETALYHAVRHEHKDMVEELLHTDIKLASIRDDQNVSPMYLATVLNSLPTVTSLVRCLSEKNVENVPREAYSGPDGRTALHAAALRDKDFVQQILDLSMKAEEIKSTADKAGGTPLHYAASVNNVAAVQLLLKADITSAYVTNNCGLFPVHIAAKLGHVEVLTELFKKCPDSDELLDGRGRNFIHLAVEEKNEAVVQWVCRNVKFEKAINMQDKEGNTPLHLAVKAKDKHTFGPLILSRRASFSCVNKNGMTPLDIADAQRKDVFSHSKNPEHVIYQTLGLIGCPQGVERMDRVRQENSHQIEEQKEKEKKERNSHQIEEQKEKEKKERNSHQNEEDKEKKEEERYENMAKSMSLGSVLIASAAFAAAFSVSGLYINKRDLYNTPHLNMAFKVFVVMDAYAFFCSIIATCLLIEAALNFLHPAYRKKYLIQCTALVMMAARGFIVAFALGVYVILNPVSKWLAILVALAGAFGSALIQPHQWPSWLELKTRFKYMGWNGLLWKKHAMSGKIPAKPLTSMNIIARLESNALLMSISSYCFAVLWVVNDGLSNAEINGRLRSDFPAFEVIILSLIILMLLPSSFLPVYSIMMEKHLKPSKKVQCIL